MRFGTERHITRSIFNASRTRIVRPTGALRSNIMGELTDKIKGNVNEAIGKIKQNSSDAETQAEGKAQELKGKAQQAVGKVKGALGDDI